MTLRQLDLEDLLDLDEFEAHALGRWDVDLAAVIQGGAGTGATVAANLAAHRRWVLRPRVLADVHVVDTGTTVLGRAISLPVLVGPSGLHTLVHPDGEVATSEGAARAGTGMVLSAGTGKAMAEVGARGDLLWFQLYWGSDRERLRALVDEAADAGFAAICLTVDMPVRPLLGRQMRAGALRMAAQTPLYILPRTAHLSAGAWDHDPSLTWADLAWLRQVCPLPVVLKGVMTAEDAGAAVRAGVDAVIVSNHGGRALDGATATLDVLPEVVEAVAEAGGGVEVYVDGGFRQGRDVLVALALGARAVLVARPALWGLCAGGAPGVARVLTLLRQELAATMAMVGAADVAALDASRIRPAP